MIEVVDVPGQLRYVISDDGVPAGFAAYVLRGGRRIFVHTEIDEGHGGEGLGSRLAHDALELARRSGQPVVALCPFIAAYLQSHHEFDDLIDHELSDRLGDA
jgi:predicted GNAT family acetyltransferase